MRSRLLVKSGVQPRLRARAADDELAHVRDVEHAGRRAHRAVLGEDAARIMHGHRPAAEADHPAAEAHMRRVQRRLLEGRRGAVSAVAGAAGAGSEDTRDG